MPQELAALYRTPLFERQPRGVRPTVAGETAIRRARQMLHEIGDALGETHLVASGASGRIRLGVLPVALPTLYQRVLTEAHRLMSQLIVNVIEGLLESLLGSLKRKELDVIMARLSPESHQPAFVTESLYPESVSLVVRSAHPLSKKRRVKMNELHGHDWTLSPESAPRALGDRSELQSKWVESTVGLD